MNTNLGRVVYDRPKHDVDTAAAVRFTAAVGPSDSLRDFADSSARVQMRYLLDKEATWLQAIAFLLRTMTTTATLREISLSDLINDLLKLSKTADWITNLL